MRVLCFVFMNRSFGSNTRKLTGFYDKICVEEEKVGILNIAFSCGTDLKEEEEALQMNLGFSS